MKLNLDKPVVGLKGKPMNDKVLLSEMLANVLAMSTVGRPARMMSWAVNLMNDGEIEIEKSEKKFISELIENSPNIVNLVKLQLLREIEKLKE